MIDCVNIDCVNIDCINIDCVNIGYVKKEANINRAINRKVKNANTIKR